MRLLVQRVFCANVEVDDSEVTLIGEGALLFLGVAPEDAEKQATQLAQKIATLRMFEDEEGKMNLSLKDLNREVLVVSQFTLYADTNQGRRPSFTKAAKPEVAKPLYEFFVKELEREGLRVSTGIFGAEMKVGLINDGPVTFWIDSSV